MAADKLVDSALLDAALGDIADVIRSKTGISGSFDFPTPNDISDVIDLYLLMPTGTKSITENGSNIDVASYAKVDVNVSGGGGGIPLPTGWTQLDYADATGSCAVDTGMKFHYPSTGCCFFIKFGVLDSTSVQIVCSSSSVGSSANYVDQIVLLQSKIRMDRCGATNRFGINVGDDIEYFACAKQSDSGYFSFGHNITTCGAYSGGDNTNLINIANPTNNMILFAEYKNGAYQTFANVRFYEMYYAEGSTEIIHLYPVKDNNNVICLFDTVSNTAIYPATGQLVYNAPQLMSAGRILLGV